MKRYSYSLVGTKYFRSAALAVGGMDAGVCQIVLALDWMVFSMGKATRVHIHGHPSEEFLQGPGWWSRCGGTRHRFVKG